jgi:eukaryotic-like serine/threonine-protein kinase
MRKKIGPYTLHRKLGQGGMGAVYAATDGRGGREVAIKLVREAATDAELRERLRREARAVSGIEHPNICRLYEFNDDEEPYIVMELLRGETLAERVARAPLLFQEAVQVSLSILSALEVLHRRNLVHRDLKPSNVFVTPEGIKLLDFGLVRYSAVISADGDDETSTALLEQSLTRTGAIVGTPYYMSPEQVAGRPVGPVSDLFTVGGLLFEMLTGRRAFESSSVFSVLHAILNDSVPVLTGSAAIASLDRIIHRATAKRPEDRYGFAAEMADDLRAALLVPQGDGAVAAHALTALLVLPFQLLKPDSEIEFLSVSLADAISSSLAGLESLVVRSPMTGARYAGGQPDLAVIAAEAKVDVVLRGTLVRSAERMRVSCQLLEVPAGTILWSHTLQVSMQDVFQVEDELADRIIDALALPLTEREDRLLKRDIPASARAYEFYLRAMQARHSPEEWLVARDLYRRAIEEDPRYAPAWARLARIHFLIGKYTGEPGAHFEQAETAVRRALDLNPGLPLAQNFYSSLEVELGRPIDALERLLHAAANRRSDPELFAGLVHVARYCGLLDVSLLADEAARRLDAAIRTSVTHTWFMRGEYERTIATSTGDIGYVDAVALSMLGRDGEAIARLAEREPAARDRKLYLWLAHLRATLEGRSSDAVALILELSSSVRDPESLYYLARVLARNSAAEQALAHFKEVVARGYYCSKTFVRDPWLDVVRSRPEFAAAVSEAQRKNAEALQKFASADGLLGLGHAKGQTRNLY